MEACVRTVKLRECFDDPSLDVMNFLNEVVLDYPSAISFAPGRPPDALFDVEGAVNCAREFIGSEADRLGLSRVEVWQRLGQYSSTNGLINARIAAQLLRDEGIQADPESVIVTVGAQEAMAVILTGLFDPLHDLLLVSDPTYIGITGLARILGIRTLAVPTGPAGLRPADVRQAISSAAARGRPRALYDIPDFNNPLGVSLALDQRMQLLEVCREEDMLYLEDNAYGMFAYDGERLPTMKSLDRHGSVIYIGSYSKTLFPGLRLGFLVADQKVEGSDFRLAQQLSKVKSLITVNTPSLCQTIVASVLNSHGNSLEPIVALKRAWLQRNRDVMIDSLAREFGDCPDVYWNRPRGGFFLALNLPFEFGAEQLARCAADFGVIVCPMSFLSCSGNRRKQIRLSFSYVTECEIIEGVRRLSRFCRREMDLPDVEISSSR